MPKFEPAYLIRGDDHGRIAERRARLRALAEAESGIEGVEVLEGEASTPQAAAAALSAMTLSLGRRFVIVDGAEHFKESDLAELEAALAQLDGDTTTVAFFAREEGRAQVPASLAAAVERAGGKVSVEAAVKPWELPKWVAARARDIGVDLDAGAAKALVAQVGERQQRLTRELEKLALALGAGSVGAEEIAALAAGSSERRAWSLADALVARDGAAATRIYLALSAQAERLPGLLHWMVQRMRLALEVVTRLDDGEPAAAIKRSLRMPPKAAERFIEDARAADEASLRRALEQLADLELDSRGGRPVPEQTAVLRTILRLSV